jgi:hypothetical protein
VGCVVEVDRPTEGKLTGRHAAEAAALHTAIIMFVYWKKREKCIGGV